jgi:hypothetical protein
MIVHRRIAVCVTGRTKVCKYLTNDYIRKKLEWICKNFLKVLDSCGVEY